MEASVPPAIMASASPRWMMRKASPMEWAVEVQAVAVASLGPRAPYLMETWPAARLMMEPGMKKGETLRGPPVSRLMCSRSMTSKPPMPEPMWTPTRSWLDSSMTEAGVGHRLCRGGEGEVDEAAHLAGLFFVDEEERVEVLDLGGEADGMAGEIEGLDLGHAAAAGEQAFPDLGGGFADPADEADAGDDDATPLLVLHGLRLGHCYLAAFWFFSM